MDSRKRIVILGAGFGGLRAAILISKKLRRLRLLDKYQIILVDRNEHHTYTPLLYEVSTTSKQTADLSELHGVVAYGLAKLTRKLPLAFIRNEVKNINFASGEVRLARGQRLTADYLLLALGSETNYFNIKGLKEHSLSLKTLIDAVKLRDAILNLLENGKDELTIVIGGGGSTGVELAAELKMWCGELEEEHPPSPKIQSLNQKSSIINNHPRDSNRKGDDASADSPNFKLKGGRKKCRLNVVVVEAAPTILPGFSPKIVGMVKKRLAFLKVNLLEGETIESVEKNRIILKSSSTALTAGSRQVDFDVFVWAGGVKTSSVLEDILLKTEARGRIEVEQGMKCLLKTPDLKILPKIYAIGDNTCVYNPETKKPIPGVARAAIKEAGVAAHNIIEEIKAAEDKTHKPKAISYKPRDYPYIIPVGGKFAVAKIDPSSFPDFSAGCSKGSWN